MFLSGLAVAYKPERAGDGFWLVVFVALFYGGLFAYLGFALIRHWRQRAAYRMLRQDHPAGRRIGSVHRARKHIEAWDKATDERERTAG